MKKVKPNKTNVTEMGGEEFLSDMPKKSAGARKKITSKTVDGEKFLSTKEKKIKSFEAFVVPQRPEQGDKYQQLDTEEHSANTKTDIPSQEPISRPNDGDTHQNLQDDTVSNKATNKIKNARAGQGDKYQKLSTGKMKSFESFINENYLDADDKIAKFQDGAKVKTESGQIGFVDRVEIQNENGKRITKYLVKIPDTDPERAAKGYKSSGFFTEEQLESFNENYKDRLKELDDQLEKLLDSEPENKEEEKEAKELIKEIEDEINQIKADIAEKE